MGRTVDRRPATAAVLKHLQKSRCNNNPEFSILKTFTLVCNRLDSLQKIVYYLLKMCSSTECPKKSGTFVQSHFSPNILVSVAFMMNFLKHSNFLQVICDWNKRPTFSGHSVHGWLKLDISKSHQHFSHLFFWFLCPLLSSQSSGA